MHNNSELFLSRTTFPVEKAFLKGVFKCFVTWKTIYVLFFFASSEDVPK